MNYHLQHCIYTQGPKRTEVNNHQKFDWWKLLPRFPEHAYAYMNLYFKSTFWANASLTVDKRIGYVQVHSVFICQVLNYAK